MLQMSLDAARQIGSFVGIATLEDVVRLLAEDQQCQLTSPTTTLAIPSV